MIISMYADLELGFGFFKPHQLPKFFSGLDHGESHMMVQFTTHCLGISQSQGVLWILIFIHFQQTIMKFMFVGRVHDNPWWSWHLHHSVVLHLRLRKENQEISWIKGMLVIPDIHSTIEKMVLGTWTMIGSMSLGWASTSPGSRLLTQKKWLCDEATCQTAWRQMLSKSFPRSPKMWKSPYGIPYENHYLVQLAAFPVVSPIPAVSLQWCSVFGIYSQW